MQRTPWRLGFVTAAASIGWATLKQTPVMFFPEEIDGLPVRPEGAETLVLGSWAFFLAVLLVGYFAMGRATTLTNLKHEIVATSRVSLIVTPLAAFVIVGPALSGLASFALMRIAYPMATGQPIDTGVSIGWSRL